MTLVYSSLELNVGQDHPFLKLISHKQMIAAQSKKGIWMTFEKYVRRSRTPDKIKASKTAGDTNWVNSRGSMDSPSSPPRRVDLHPQSPLRGEETPGLPPVSSWV